MSTATELFARRELLWNLTLREMRGRYKRSVLGWGWSMLNPLATMAIYTVIFSVFLPTNPEPGHPSGLHVYALYLMCGLLPWNFFAISVAVGMGSVVSNGGLVKKVAFPREHLVLATVSAGLMTFGIELAVLTVVLIGFGNFVVPWLPVVVVVAFLTTLFVTGIALALAAANVYFRDLTYLWGIATQAWFFLTPIVYSVTSVAKKLHGLPFRLYNNQPMAVVVRMFRNLLYDMRMPRVTDFVLLTGYGVVTLAIGWWIFAKLEGRFAEEL
jgi:ABC-type polysaccharide/polyol phosphate export permease